MSAGLAAVPGGRPAWRDHGSCRGLNPTLFYPQRGESFAEAQAVCASCPVREACLDYALDHREVFGVWGGATERERRRLRHQRRAVAA